MYGSPCRKLLSVAMPRSFSGSRKEDERWSRFPDFRKEFSKSGNLCFLSNNEHLELFVPYG